MLDAVRDSVKTFNESQRDLTFEALQMDSFDLVTLRIGIEQKVGARISDEAWFAFRTVGDIVNHYEDRASTAAALSQDSETLPVVRSFKLNMPQMSIGGMSEYWLFREFGDIHWTAICDGLECESHAILDELGNRLYATFVRFRWEGTEELSAYRENEAIEIRSELSRFGRGMFFSKIALAGEAKSIRANLMTAFASRTGGNESLMKGEPNIPAGSPVTALDRLPDFSEEYRQVRKGLQRSVQLKGSELKLEGELGEVAYSINPYHDVNGVKLLYFAAYPAISDYCEREFVHRHRERYRIRTDWALETATIARDVLYFSNCEISEELIYRIHSLEENGDRLNIASSLSRRSDGHVLCNLFTVKTRI